jgi:arylsulfatase A-like enzyme
MSSWTRRPLIAVGLATLVSSAVGPLVQSATDEPAALQGAVLIVLDTVRADRLSAYGHHRPTTPALEALASRGVLFERAIATAPWTLPSVASLLSGRWAKDALDLSGPKALLQGGLAESFREAGFRTAAFTEGGFVSRHYGFDLGFLQYEEDEGPAKGSIEKTFEKARRWLAAHRHERFFVLIHTYEAHTPYRRRTFTAGLDPGRVGASLEIPRVSQIREGQFALGAEEMRYIAALYDGGILECDRQIESLLAFLNGIGLRDRTLLVVTSDHGEEFGEHFPRHVAGHGHALVDAQIRVPLIVSNPIERYPVRRVAQQVSLIDVLPTVAEAMAVELPRVDGVSLLPLMRGEVVPERTLYGGNTNRGPIRSFVRTHRYKYIETTGIDVGKFRGEVAPVQLYDLRADGGEQANLATSRPELAAQLARRLHEHREGAESRPLDDDVPDALRDRLRSLGYLDDVATPSVDRTVREPEPAN